MKKNKIKKTYKGKLDFSNKKDPFIFCDKIPQQIRLNSSIVNFLHDDFVEFEILSRKRKGFYLGNIISLIEREKKEYVAIIQINKSIIIWLILDYSIFICGYI